MLKEVNFLKRKSNNKVEKLKNQSKIKEMGKQENS